MKLAGETVFEHTYDGKTMGIKSKNKNTDGKQWGTHFFKSTIKAMCFYILFVLYFDNLPLNFIQ